MSFWKESILKKVLEKASWIAFPIVMILIASIGLLILLSVYKLMDIVLFFFDSGKLVDVKAHYVSAQVISIIEIFVLIIGIYIFASSIYHFFIGSIKQNKNLKVETLDDLKASIAKIIVLFLVSFLGQEIVSWVNPMDILYIGITIALACGILIWFIIATKSNNDTKK